MLRAVAMGEDPRGTRVESEHGARRARRWVWVLFALAPLMILAAVVVSLLVPQGTASFVLPPARQQDAAVVLGVAALAISTASLTWMVRAARSGPAVAAISSFSVHQHRQAAARIRRGERVPEAEVAVSTAVAWALVRLRKVIAVYLGVVLAAVAMALFLDSWWVLLLAGLGAVLVATSALIENRGARRAQLWLAADQQP